MRPPLKGLFPAEATSKPRLAGLVLLLAIIDLAIIAWVFESDLSSLSIAVVAGQYQAIDPEFLMWIRTWGWEFLFGVIFANVTVMYLYAIVLDSAEARLILGWSLHASVWLLLFIVTWHTAPATLW